MRNTAIIIFQEVVFQAATGRVPRRAVIVAYMPANKGLRSALPIELIM